MITYNEWLIKEGKEVSQKIKHAILSSRNAHAKTLQAGGGIENSRIALQAGESGEHFEAAKHHYRSSNELNNLADQIIEREGIKKTSRKRKSLRSAAKAHYAAYLAHDAAGHEKYQDYFREKMKGLDPNKAHFISPPPKKQLPPHTQN